MGYNEVYRFANIDVQIASEFPYVQEMCKGYRSEGEPELTITTTQRDIDFERERAKKVARKEGRPEPNHSDGYLETLAVYRKIAEEMPRFDRMLMHGSCVAVDGAA